MNRNETPEQKYVSITSPLTEATLCILSRTAFCGIASRTRCRAIGEHLAVVRMKNTMSCMKTGAAPCSSMINLCSPGLLLSAVVTFYSPFTQFYVSNTLVQRCGPICWRKRRSSSMQGASVIPPPPSLWNASFANTCSEHTWSCAKQPGQAQKVAAPSPPAHRRCLPGTASLPVTVLLAWQ